MYKNKKIVVVMPAYNAAQTLRKTYDEVMAQGIVDIIIVVDDASHDKTTALARELPNTVVHTHPDNRGYGANQKTCYKLALQHQADIVIMVHPDYQYTPKLIPAMASMIGNELYHCVLGSRILGGYAITGVCQPVSVIRICLGHERSCSIEQFRLGHEVSISIDDLLVLGSVKLVVPLIKQISDPRSARLHLDVKDPVVIGGSVFPALRSRDRTQAPLCYTDRLAGDGDRY